MTEAIRAQATATLAEVEKVTAVLLPEPSATVVPLAEAQPPVAEAIRKRMAELNMSDSASIIGFGSGAPGGIAGHQPADAGGCEEQGRWPGG